MVPNSGIPPYSFLWSNGDTTTTTSFSKHGPISVVITDSNGCSYTAHSSIIKKGDFTASISEVTNVKCFGGSTGTARVTTSIPFPTSFTWSNGASTQYVEGLAAGTYSVTVTDVDGCEARASAEVLQPTAIQVKKNQSNQPVVVAVLMVIFRYLQMEAYLRIHLPGRMEQISRRLPILRPEIILLR